jgi:hypothetical protein
VIKGVTDDWIDSLVVACGIPIDPRCRIIRDDIWAKRRQPRHRQVGEIAQIERICGVQHRPDERGLAVSLKEHVDETLEKVVHGGSNYSSLAATSTHAVMVEIGPAAPN